MTDDGDADLAEQARAASLARRVDELLAGRPAPPAMAAEDRALLEAAAIIHGAMIDPGTAPVPRPSGRGPAAQRAAPWAIAACAAALAIWLAAASAGAGGALPAPSSADALVGQIEPSRAADAGRRTDLLYADRLAGYRQAHLGSVRR